MPPVSFAASIDLRASERFLCATERRAWQMAMLATSDSDAAMRVVEDTFHDFAARRDPQGDSDWAVLFWRLLDARLAARQRALRPRWRLGSGPHVKTADAGKLPDGNTDPAPRGAFMDASDRDALNALTTALQALPMPARHAFLLRVRENLDVPATASILRLPDTAVRTHLFHALQQLRSRLRLPPHGPGGQSTPADGAWILRCRALLDRAAHDLDDATLSRLNLARHAVLAPAAMPAPARSSGNRWLVGAGGLAIVAGVALALTRLLPVTDPMPTPVSAPDETPAPAPPPRIAPSEDTPLAAPDFDLLLDVYDEALLDDLEFHAWLAADALPNE